MYLADQEDINRAASQQTFNRIWREKFSHLIIPKYNTLGACDTCTKLREIMNNRTKENIQLSDKAGLDMKAHLQHVSKERTEKQQRENHSKNYPSQTWCVSLDQMQDQFLPYSPRLPKSVYVLFLFIILYLSFSWRKHRPAMKVFGYAAYGPGKNRVVKYDLYFNLK